PSLVTATVSNSNVPSAWTDSYISLSGGTDTLVLERREVGSLTRVANMLVGPLGAALSKAGITSTQICSTGFSGSTNIELPGESIVVAISPSTAPMPTGLIVSPETYSLVDFDKKLTLTINGVT